MQQAPASAFECHGTWQAEGGQTLLKGAWQFVGGGQRLTFLLNPLRGQWQWQGQPIGWSELLPPLGNLPLLVVVRREDFRWLAYFRRRLIAFSFADLPPTEQVVAEGVAAQPTFAPLPFPPEGAWQLPKDWRSLMTPEGETAFVPTNLQRQQFVPLSASLGFLTDFTVTAEVRLNGGQAIGLAFNFGEEGGYVWRWRREGSEARLQLVCVERESDGRWREQVLWDEPADFSPFHWQRLQVWCSGGQIWAGLDGEVLVFCQDHRFAIGQVGLWLERGDEPLSMVRSVRGARWWCAALMASDDTPRPFPTLSGQWRLGVGVWSLQSFSDRPAIALLGEAPLPSWWVADVFWQGQEIGLLWAWRSEEEFGLLRLRPEEATKGAVEMALLWQRQGRTTLLSRERLWLQRGAPYRLAIQLTPTEIVGYLNGIPLVRAQVSPKGKVGLWAKPLMTLQRIWLVMGEPSLLPLTPERGGAVQPFVTDGWIAHEAVSLTLPAGLPVGVPQSVRLSSVPVTLQAERIAHHLSLQLSFEGKPIGATMLPMPRFLPLTLRLERRERWLLVWLGERLVLTAKMP
ncbi:MAG: hypothetical protein HZLCBSQH_001756 [Candidatus Fervidibacterota bacterium]